MLDTVGLASVEPVRQRERPRPSQHFFCRCICLGCDALSESGAGLVGGLAAGAKPVRAAQGGLAAPDQQGTRGPPSPGLSSAFASRCLLSCCLAGACTTTPGRTQPCHAAVTPQAVLPCPPGGHGGSSTPAHPSRPAALAGDSRSCARDSFCVSAQGPIEWHVDAIKALPAPVLRRINQAIMRTPRYPGLCLPSQGLDTPKLDASDLLTLAKLLPVALLREPQAQVQMTSLLLLLGWLLTRDQAIHTDDTLARLRDNRVKCGPRSLFHGMRSVAARWEGHVSASRVAVGWGGVKTARMVLRHASSSHITTPCGAPCRVRCVDACHLRDAHDSRGERCRWRLRPDWRWAAQR